MKKFQAKSMLRFLPPRYSTQYQSFRCCTMDLYLTLTKSVEIAMLSPVSLLFITIAVDR